MIPSSTSTDQRSPQLPVQLPGYTWGGCLYQGAKTAVYSAVEIATGRSVVIKYLSQDYPSFGELVQFRNQYTVAKHLSIPGIVQPLGLEPLGNSYALIMEDVGSISLADYARQYPLTLTEILGITCQLADTLHALHQQRVIHKDIKPDNILIHPDSKQVKLIDFSIALLLPKETQTIQSPTSLEGTLAYMSPEQTGRMNRAVDYRTDFYGLGATFYQLLTGQLPFASDDPLELVYCHLAQSPVTVDQLNSAVPPMVSAIVAKLMAKNAEDRYQSALGLKHDLEQCLIQWKEQEEIAEFELGQRDICDRFLIPEKLYGREAEIQALLEAFHRVSQGASELMLVAGFSGIGKTAVVNEIHKPIVRQRGYFIKGKFDQFNRNIPFSAFVQAFRNLMAQLLSESDAALSHWKKQILQAVGSNGRVLIEVIPELEKIIGSQPVAPELSGAAAQNRFNLLFQKFIAVFTCPAHPLVMFLDDLQWADSASLNLMQVLMGEHETAHLLLLGAYRDNEVFPAHPLMLTLNELEKQSATTSTMTLTPLLNEHINQLVAETLNYQLEAAQPLTDLIYQQTKGNPFFTTQCLKGVYKDKLIRFKVEQGTWDYDLVQIQAALCTDDVAVFMASQLQKLPQATQNVLALAACIGNQFDLETLAIVCKASKETVASDLWAALQEGLIIPITEAYKLYQEWQPGEHKHYADEVAVDYRFLHDRVQQAAYSLILDEQQKQSTHLQIGQRLLAYSSPTEREDNVFSILNHLMMGIEADPDAISGIELAELALLAGMKAKLSVAYQAAIDYFSFGLSRLPDNAWETQYRLVLDLNREYGECDYFLGEFDASETRLNDALNHIESPLDAAQIYDILMDLRVNRGIDLESALDAGLKGLAVLGMNIPSDPSSLKALTNQELQNVQRVFEQMAPDALLDLPLMSNPVKRSCMKLLGTLWATAYNAGNENLILLSNLKSIGLSLEYGQAEGSSLAYTSYGMALASQGKYEQAYEFGKVALELDRKMNSSKFIGKNNNLFSHAIGPYVLPLKENLPLYQEAMVTSIEVGDLVYGVWAVLFIIWTHLLKGSPLPEVEEQIQQYLGYVQEVNNPNISYVFQLQQKFTQTLTDNRDYEELSSYKGFVDNPSVKAWQENGFCFGVNWYGFLVMHRLYLDREYSQAIQVARFIEATYPEKFGFFPVILYYFYYTLSLTAVYQDVDDSTQVEYWGIIQEQQQLFEKWAQTCPSTFLHKHDLLAAEVARLNGNLLAAMNRYEQAIAGAKNHGFIQEEALANELTAKFYLDWGKEKIAAIYMQEAYYCYARWGAKAKVATLETCYPELLQPILQPRTAAGNMLTALMTIAAPTTSVHASPHHSASTTNLNQTLDFANVLKASQSLSGTIQLDKLLQQLIQIILQNSGGDSCALLLANEVGEWQLQALSTRDNTQLCRDPLENHPNLPVKLIQYVKNTQEVVVIDDLETDLPIIDDYLTQHQPKSILALPILNQGHLIGILYLQNSLTSGVFTQEQLIVLNFLCTQAAISLENAQLYQQVQQSLTDLKNAQLKLVQGEKMSALGGLVAGVAHEINNPVGCILGNVRATQNYISDLLGLLDLYAERFPEPGADIEEELEDVDLDYVREDLPNLIRAMKDSGDRIKSISKSLRTFSRSDTENKQIFNLHEGLDSTLLILRHRLKANESRPAIEVETDYGNLPDVSCFPGQLNQVFMNILANAIDALDEASQHRSFADIKANPNRITVRTQLNDQQVAILISDNGPGIPETVKAKIFDHLFTTKEVGKGTGLGLAIARQIIVEGHSGKIGVNSEPEQGTEFCLSIPL